QCLTTRLAMVSTARALAEPVPGGALRVVGPGGTAGPACPLVRTDVTATVSGFVARVAVTQVSPTPPTDPVEAIYTFPLSEPGAGDAMTMKTGDRVIQAEIDRREEARRR